MDGNRATQEFNNLDDTYLLGLEQSRSFRRVVTALRNGKITEDQADELFEKFRPSFKQRMKDFFYGLIFPNHDF